MRNLAAEFDGEIALPAFPMKVAGIGDSFLRETRAAGPLLAGASTLPDLVGSYKAYDERNNLEKEVPYTDEQGNALDPEERKRRIRKRKKELAGGVGKGLGSAAGSLAGWAIPVSTMGGPAGLVVGGLGSLAASALGSRAGKVIGEEVGS